MRLLLFLVVIFFKASLLISQSDLYQKFEMLLPEFTVIRQELHACPELKYEERKTAEYIANKLREYGYDVRTGIAGTGISALLDSRKEGKTVAIRAEMDGLPILEKTGLQYESRNVGQMHACGHDGHMATALMIAKYLKDHSDEFTGKIKFIFQPAEEGGAGALKMIDEGILEKVDAIFGYHNYSLGLNCIGVRAGCLMAGNDRFEISVQGKDGHAAMPHLTLNPIMVGASLITFLQAKQSQKNPTDPSLVNFTAFNSGNTYNVVPESATIKGTVRTISNETRSSVITSMQTTCDGYAMATGAKIDLHILDGNYPPVINTKSEVELVKEAAAQVKGDLEVIILEQPIMPAEDFAFYLQHIPGCFFFVGNGEESRLHTDDYDFNDAIMPTAASVLTQAALNFLKAP